MTHEDPFRPALEQATARALAHLDRLYDAPVAATTSLAALRERLGRPLGEDGVDAEQVIQDLVDDASGGIIGSAGGRFFGWVIGGSLPAALGADWLTSTWDQNAAAHACGPAVAVMEEIAGQWLKDLLGLPERAGFAMVTGSQMAHATCLAAARNALLHKHDWDVERRGLNGAPPVRIISSRERHGSIARAVRLLGFGTDCIVDVPPNEAGVLDAKILEKTLQADPDAPTIVLLQAGDINTGAFDRFTELTPLAHRYDAWVHVDGAFGLWATASPKYRHFTDGVEQADSWTTDGHKWLNVPYDAGYAFVADPDVHRHAMTQQAGYVTFNEEARDQMDWNPEWSRRARGAATYAALRQLGRSGVTDLIDRTCRHAHSLVTRIGALPGAEMMWEPLINQGLVRFLDPKPDAAPADHDRRTDAVIEAILHTGEAFFSGTVWRGMRCMRVSVCNWQTSEHDVDRTVEAVESVLRNGRF